MQWIFKGRLVFPVIYHNWKFMKLWSSDLSSSRSYYTLYVVVVQLLSPGRLCDPMDCSTPAFSVLPSLPQFAQIMSIELVMPSNHLILCRPLLLLPSIFPSIRVFSNESALCIRWLKCWSFSFSISPSNEYLGLISFRID